MVLEKGRDLAIRRRRESTAEDKKMRPDSVSEDENVLLTVERRKVADAALLTLVRPGSAASALALPVCHVEAWLRQTKPTAQPRIKAHVSI
jgi:hypothetical protein